MKMKSTLFLSSALLMASSFSFAVGGPTTEPSVSTTQPTAVRGTETKPGERVPSDDPMLADFHSLGLVEGEMDLFRCGSPVRDLMKNFKDAPTQQMIDTAHARMQRMHDLGIRTIISLEDVSNTEDKGKHMNERVALEKQAAQSVGIAYVSHPLSNSGKNSMEDASDEQVVKWIDPIAAEILADGKNGGVVFHCSAGHDRTGIVTAYIRMKYQHWPVDEAITEMRRYGHNWPKYSANGGVSSWHEEHLKAIAKMLAEATTPEEKLSEVKFAD